MVGYGLSRKQSARAWKSLVHNPRLPPHARRRVYVCVLANGRHIYFALYVNDILTFAHPTISTKRSRSWNGFTCFMAERTSHVLVTARGVRLIRTVQ